MLYIINLTTTFVSSVFHLWFMDAQQYLLREYKKMIWGKEQVTKDFCFQNIDLKLIKYVNGLELHIEDVEMNNKVLGYAMCCKQDKCQIWSLRVLTNPEIRFTIRIENNMVEDVLGYDMRKPTIDEQLIIDYIVEQMKWEYWGPF